MIKKEILTSTQIKTPLGTIVAVASETSLFLLEFADRKELPRELTSMKKHKHAELIEGSNPIIASIEQELAAYFIGKKTTFHTPITFFGTPFQQKVWKELQKIPYGQTISYGEIAHRIHNPKSSLAVGQAVGANQLALVIPCHRVIHANGNLGGYAGGVDRKSWLLKQERFCRSLSA